VLPLMAPDCIEDPEESKGPGSRLVLVGASLCTLTIAQSQAGSGLQACVGRGAVVHPSHSAQPSRVRAPGLCWTGRRCAP